MKLLWVCVLISGLALCSCNLRRNIGKLIRSSRPNGGEYTQWQITLPKSDMPMLFVYAEAGSVKMGLSTDEVSAVIRESQNPVYEIEEVAEDRLWQQIPKGFLIGKYEVTHEQYQALIPDHHYLPTDARKPVTNLREKEIRTFCQLIDDAYPQFDIGLPTEQEWEYAAKGSTANQRYTWNGKFDTHKANVSSQQPMEVGKFPKSNSWCGASDMIGNAAEVCEIDTEIYVQKTEHPLVARGGSYTSDEYECRTTSRHLLWNPQRDNIGFRIIIRLGK
jgi:formylglycine-generating enzyme required for sulfatase activity